jgi:transcriptional regulator with XRE-family HTH domain
MELLSVIRRWAFRDKLSIREISRRTGLSRNTIRKYLRSGLVEPSFKTPDRPSKLDAFADKLSAWLRSEASKSRKQKRTLKQLHTVSNRFQARPPFAANPDPLAAKGIRGMRARDNQDENAPPPSRRREA